MKFSGWKILAVLFYLVFTPGLAQNEEQFKFIPISYLLGTENPVEALKEIESLKLEALSPAQRLEVLLVAVDLSLELQFQEKAESFLSKAQAVGDLHPEIVTPLFRFVTASLEQEHLRQFHPSKGRQVLLANLSHALRGLGEKSSASIVEHSLTIGLPLVGRSFTYWSASLVENAVALELDIVPKLRQVQEAAEELTLFWASSEMELPTLEPALGYLSGVMRARTSLKSGDPLLAEYGVTDFLQEIRIRSKAKGLGAEVEALLGRTLVRHKLEELVAIVERAHGRKYTESEAKEVRGILESIMPLLGESASVRLAHEVQITAFAAAFSSVKPNWALEADKSFYGYDAPSNIPEFEARTLGLRAKLHLHQGRTAEAIRDGKASVFIYQQLMHQAVLKRSVLHSLRRHAKSSYDILLQALIKDGRGEEAFLAVVDYQKLEGVAALGKSDGESQNTGLRAYQQALEPKTAILALYPGPDKIYSFLLKKDDFKFAISAIPEDELKDTMTKLHRQIARLESTNSHSRSLYNISFEPFHSTLQGVESVKILPSSFLFNLPWSCLVSPDGQTLSDKFALGLSYDLKASHSDLAINPNVSLTALGDPDGSLPSAASEVRALKSDYPQSRIATGEEANREFLDSFPGGILHLATHGVVNFRRPEESYLVLGGGETLAASEVRELGLPSKEDSLIVLSACDTASVSDGDVGLRSLAGSFLKEQAPAVMATLWPIDDEASQIFVSYFYQSLKKGSPPVRALSTAQAQVRAKEKYQHPYFWAGFVLLEN